MNRFALTYLESWKNRPDRKPLVIRGARQVGKTYLVRDFGKQNFTNIVEVNFERNPAHRSLFTSNSPRKIVQLLEIQFEVSIDLGDTLIFLDEIQASGEVLAVLRYFYEELPELHVIAAGSLLEFVLADHSFSMPVGRIEYLHLGPLTFEEFLVAIDRSKLCDYLSAYTLDNTVPDALHAALIEQFRYYLAVGGMPAVVSSFLENHRLADCDRVKHSILATFEDDFSKYSPRVDVSRVRRVFGKLPLMVGQKFKYANVDRSERAKDIAGVLDLLCQAKIAHRVTHSSSNGVPLGAEIKRSVFKVIFLDVGLMSAVCGLTLIDFENVEELTQINQGAVCEQFIGQHLLYSDATYKSPELYYWAREKPNSSAEIDYVMSVAMQVIPVEVKAGKTGRLKSLELFLVEKDRRLGVRFNSEKPSIVDSTSTFSHAKNHTFRLISLPLYMVGQVKRLIAQNCGHPTDSPS